MSATKTGAAFYADSTVIPGPNAGRHAYDEQNGRTLCGIPVAEGAAVVEVGPTRRVSCGWCEREARR